MRRVPGRYERRRPRSVKEWAAETPPLRQSGKAASAAAPSGRAFAVLGVAASTRGGLPRRRRGAGAGSSAGTAGGSTARRRRASRPAPAVPRTPRSARADRCARSGPAGLRRGPACSRLGPGDRYGRCDRSAPAGRCDSHGPAGGRSAAAAGGARAAAGRRDRRCRGCPCGCGRFWKVRSCSSSVLPKRSSIGPSRPRRRARRRR